VKPHTSSPLPIASVANASSQAQRRKHRDPYVLAQARQRKAANLKRQEELKKEREEALGDPVRGITTPFVESFDTAALPATLGIKSTEGEDVSTKVSDAATNVPLNHFVKPSELEQALQHSYILTQPLISKNPNLRDPAQEAEELKRHAEAHERATAAVARILSLANGNQKDRTRYNIQRCIETFGRHNTDSVLTPRAPSNQPRAADKTPLAAKTPRAGPDTGSSEVQIAILTAKIRVLANHLERPHYQKDKVNKRNLRVLVHRRQKLLAYLRRKERGSERWQNVVETLGLTDGTWKGEISL
jgi:ribosomal protein S15